MKIPIRLNHPFVKPFVSAALLFFITYSLLAHWEQRGNSPHFDASTRSQTHFDIDVMAAEAAAQGKTTLAAAPSPSPTEAKGGEEVELKKRDRKIVAHFLVSFDDLQIS